MKRLSEILTEFSETDYAVRTVKGLLSVMPFVPDWRHPASLQQAVSRFDPGLDPALVARVAARADELSLEPGPQAALKAFEMMDKGDKGIALLSGLKAGYQGLRGQAGALEVDPQQAADAGLKALGLAWATSQLYEGSVPDKVKTLVGSDTGRSLLVWYVAVDVVLPFADNLASGSLNVMDNIIDQQAAANAERLASMAGADIGQAQGMLAGLTGTLKNLLGQAASFSKPLSDWCQEKLPGVLGSADRVTGVIATALDALSSYRYLGAVLVAEAVILRAKADVHKQIAAEKAEALRQEELARRAEEERRAKSKVQNSYDMSASTSAAPSGIKTTRSTPDAGSQPPAKSGCMGCMGLLIAGVLLMSAGTAWAISLL